MQSDLVALRVDDEGGDTHAHLHPRLRHSAARRLHPDHDRTQIVAGIEEEQCPGSEP
jgi:hypothetical protein